MLILYDYIRSSAAFRVRIALNLKKLDYDIIPIHLLQNGGEQHANDYDKINPHHLVPAFDDTRGVITQSLAIIEYLNDCYKEPALLPEDLHLRAKARAFALSIVADIHPLNNLRVLNYLQSNLGMTEVQKIAWYQHWIIQGLHGLELQLTREKTSFPFAFGSLPSIADICLVPQLYNARRFHCDLNPYPRLLAIDAHCQAMLAFQTAFPQEIAPSSMGG